MVGLRATFHKICSESYCKGLLKCSNPLHYCLQTSMAPAVPARCHRAHQLMSRAIPHCPLNMSPSMAGRTWWGREGRWHHHQRVFHCKQVLYYAGKWFLENPASSNFPQKTQKGPEAATINAIWHQIARQQVWNHGKKRLLKRTFVTPLLRKLVRLKKMSCHALPHVSVHQNLILWGEDRGRHVWMCDTAYNHIPLCKITAQFFTKSLSRTSPTAATPRRDSTSTRSLLLLLPLPLRSPKVRTKTRAKWAK